jgi:beta-mannosidase
LHQIDWQQLEDQHSLQKKLMEHWVGLAQPDLATLIEKSQAYQSEMNRFYIDRCRWAKYAPCGGVVQFMFTDPNPAIQWSVLDYWRVPKQSYYALRDAFRPVYAFLLLSAASRRPGAAPVQIEAYVVNDTAEELGSVDLRLTVTDEGGILVAEHRAAVRVGADSPAIPALTVDESPERPGRYTVTLTMDRPGDRFVNTYHFQVE